MSMRSKLLALLMLSLGLASLTYAQRFEVTPHVGYKFGGWVPVTSDANDIGELRFDPSYSVGVNVGYNFSDHLGTEFLWNRQPTKAKALLLGGGELAEKADVDIDGYFGNIVYTFRDPYEKLRPFVFGGIGGTRATGGGASKTRVSFNVGGGVKYFIHNNMGIRLQMRWNPTYLYTTSGGIWCDWWGWCYHVPNDHYMHQGEATVGWIFRF